MKYLIVGAGAVGSAIAAFLANANKNVSLIARGKHLDSLREKGLCIKSDTIGAKIFKLPAFSKDDCCGKFDVIFVCVKSYSVNEVIPLLKKVSTKNTIIVPVLNTFGTGRKLLNAGVDAKIYDGCIYIVTRVLADYTIWQTTDIFKIVCGPIELGVDNLKYKKLLEKDLKDSQIDIEFSDKIDSDKFKKFSLTSAFASNGAYFDITAEDVQKDGIYRDNLVLMLSEMKNLAIAMNLDLDIDVLTENLAIIDAFNKETTASMQRDLKTKPESEIDGLLFDVLALAKSHNIDMPTYKKVAEKLRKNNFCRKK